MIARRVSAFFKTISDEVMSNPAFAAKLEAALRESPTGRARGKRAPAMLDPVSAFEAGGEEALRERLRTLSIDQLKDIVSEYGMDKSHLVMKWTKVDRVIEHIVGSAATRARKGDAFR